MQLEIIGTDGTVHYTRPHDHPDVWEALNTPGYSVRGTGEKRASGSLHPVCSTAPTRRLEIEIEWQQEDTGVRFTKRIPEGEAIPTIPRRNIIAWRVL